MAELKGTLTKESVRIILRSFTLNHQDEEFVDAIDANLDKINDSNVKDLMETLYDCYYWCFLYYAKREKAINKLKNIYGINIE